MNKLYNLSKPQFPNVHTKANNSLPHSIAVGLKQDGICHVFHSICFPILPRFKQPTYTLWYLLYEILKIMVGDFPTTLYTPL